MRSRPVTVANTTVTSTPGKHTLFRIALAVAMIGAVAVSTVLILHGIIVVSRLRYFVDIGLHPLHLTSILLSVLGLLSLVAFILLTIGLVKVNRTLVIVAAGLLAICSLGLIAFSVWSFTSLTGGHLADSINRTISAELDETKYSFSTGNNLIIENTRKMARLEKQHRCCGLIDPIEDYRKRQKIEPNSMNRSTSATSNRGRTSSTQRNSAAFGSTVHLPISCCKEKFRSPDDLCVDMFANNTEPSSRYNTNGCFRLVAAHKFERIKREGFTTIVAACLAVISCIALAAVVRLLNEGYQIVPLRTAM